MKIVLQRVKQASVHSEGRLLGEIGCGYLILIGIGEGDTPQQAEKLADKIKKLRVFPDEEGKTNRSIDDVNGGVLVVSQFTLYADCRKGNRPSFIGAGAPDEARKLYDYFLQLCKSRFQKTAYGSFGADMQVSLINDGPFTLILEA